MLQRGVRFSPEKYQVFDKIHTETDPNAGFKIKRFTVIK